MKKEYNIIGKKVTFKDYIEVLNPTDNKVLGSVPALTSEQVDSI